MTITPPRPSVAPAARSPRAFPLDGEKKEAVSIEAQPDFSGETPTGAEAAIRKSGRFIALSSVFWAALSLIFVLYIADAGWSLAQSFAARAPWLGQLTLGLLAIVAAGLLLFLLRELFSILRMRRVTRFRDMAEALASSHDKEAVRRFAASLSAFYADDPGSASGRAEVARALGEIHDAPVLLAIIERALLKPKDDAARQAIAEAAQRVSVVTALSPRALVDVAFVLAQSVVLIRSLSAIYGGRASGFGLLRLVGNVLRHLAVTGGVAVADEFISQFFGAGLAARLSARLGEGVLNGVLTARVGIAATGLCRPMPFIENETILLSEVAKNTIKTSIVAEKPAAQS